MKILKKLTKLNKVNQTYIIVGSVILVSALCKPLSVYTGYLTIALILLFLVSIHAMLFSVTPVLISSFLSALILDFFFIPPYYTFHVNSTEDALMLSMYFLIALLNGILTLKIRNFEKQEQFKDERLKSIKLYNTIFNSVSHEFRTPVTTIMGISENLLRLGDKATLSKRIFFVHEIILAANRLNRLIDNLLNMTRLESGFLKPKMDWCDLNELVHKVVNYLKPDMKNYDFIIDIPENFPLVKLDFGLIEQALTNLLHNILMHTPEGTMVTIKAMFNNGQLTIIIADSGPGFKKEDLKMIFEKYYRTNIHKTGGLGLGLSIVKGFIHAHNGTIDVKNILPTGAEFLISLPVESTQIEAENE
jgi:two-component system, OmpR family, sensor histidine kinase KdpD